MLANSGEEETCRRESATFVGEGELLESHVTCQISRILTNPPPPLSVERCWCVFGDDRVYSQGASLDDAGGVRQLSVSPSPPRCADLLSDLTAAAAVPSQTQTPGAEQGHHPQELGPLKVIPSPPLSLRFSRRSPRSRECLVA